jgi:hypothetical protein
LPTAATDRVLCVGLRPVPLPSLVFHFAPLTSSIAVLPFRAPTECGGIVVKFSSRNFDHSRLRIHLPMPPT